MTLTAEEREIIRVSGLSLGTQTVKDQELLPLLEQIKSTQEEMEVLYTKAKVRIVELQAQCPHVNRKEEFDPKHSAFSKKKLLSKQCVDCGFHFTKPKGMPWVVCEICWGTMKDDGYVQRQDYREHHYKCTSCGNEEFTT